MTAADLTDRRLFHHWSREKIRFADLDSLGHLNNCAFCVYCESGRVEFLEALHANALSAGAEINWVIVNLSIDFRAQAHYPGVVDVGTAVLRLGNKSVTVGQGLFVGETCIATATSTVVLSDLKAGKAVPLPDALRRRLASLAAGEMSA